MAHWRALDTDHAHLHPHAAHGTPMITLYDYLPSGNGYKARLLLALLARPYACTQVASEGGFDLGGYPAVRAWLVRVAALPGYLPITARPG